MLSFHHVSLHIQGTLCLHELTLTLKPKGVSVILGANGAGKTLLLNLCAGLLSPSSGEITPCFAQLSANNINDNINHAINKNGKKNSLLTHPNITLVPAKPVLLDKTVYQNILLPLQCNQVESAEDRCRAALEWADITSLSALPAHRLSLGQQQLVALARAWALAPQLLLLDEPCANLDPNRQQQIEHLIHALSESGCKIVMSSHHIAQAKRLADEIIFLDAGKLLAQVSTTDFFNPSSTILTPHVTEQIEHFLRYA
jgi:tungstate transport system ATP-binding protein